MDFHKVLTSTNSTNFIHLEDYNFLTGKCVTEKKYGRFATWKSREKICCGENVPMSAHRRMKKTVEDKSLYIIDLSILLSFRHIILNYFYAIYGIYFSDFYIHEINC